MRELALRGETEFAKCELGKPSVDQRRRENVVIKFAKCELQVREMKIQGLRNELVAGKLRSDIYDHPDPGGRLQLFLPAAYFLQVFPLELFLLGPDLVAQVYGFCRPDLQVAQCL
jgi:hypothetical protein